MAKLNKVAMIPSLFTLGNGVCGFASIIVASRIHPAALYQNSDGYQDAMNFLLIAGLLIFVGMIFDVLDGRFARMANSTTRFGAELDSLCDSITFGAAPAFLLLKLGPTPDHPLLYNVLFIAATSYVICTILRLARFNVETSADLESHQFFKGLPSPAAAGCIAAVAITRSDPRIYQQFIHLDQFTEVIRATLPFAAIALALLMVSNITYPHLVNQTLRGKKPLSHLVEVVALVITIFVIRELSLVIAFWGFALAGPVGNLWKQLRHNEPSKEVVR